MTASEPHIDYPRSWQFTLFGSDEDAMRADVERVLAGRRFTLDFSRRSSGGKYLSLMVELEVGGSAERDFVWNQLHGLDSVIHVL
ncbi:MAG: DUF493 domain-containing protein [Planctomycetota bacterium]